jgi:hypothetical protein
MNPGVKNDTGCPTVGFYNGPGSGGAKGFQEVLKWNERSGWN